MNFIRQFSIFNPNSSSLNNQIQTAKNSLGIRNKAHSLTCPGYFGASNTNMDLYLVAIFKLLAFRGFYKEKAFIFCGHAIRN